MIEEKYVDKYLYVYADIFFCKGYKRTMMCDLKQKKWLFIPNDYYELILLLKKHTLSSLENNNKIAIEEFYKFVELLLSNNYARLVDDISLFPDIELRWETPHFIENSIIDVDENSNHDYLKIAKELQILFCKNIQFRFFCDKYIVEIEDVIKKFVGRDFESIELVVKYSQEINEQEYLSLSSLYPSVSFIIHSAPENKFFKSKLENVYPIVGYVQYTKQIITSVDCCGVINKDSFVYPQTPRDFIEGIVRNKCLNGKISITISGEIKNCPSMKLSYGNIRTDSLMDVYNNKKFRKHWYIIKDKIQVCKDCEYRYVCNDCRAYAENKFGKPTKCSYNPYLAIWE